MTIHSVSQCDGNRFWSAGRLVCTVPFREEAESEVSVIIWHGVWDRQTGGDVMLCA